MATEMSAQDVTIDKLIRPFNESELINRIQQLRQANRISAVASSSANDPLESADCKVPYIAK